MTPQELQANLDMHTGTDGYIRWSALFRNFVLTDGTMYLAENAGAYWLMDAIASHIASYKEEGFVVAKLVKGMEGKLIGAPDWVLTLDDGNGRVLASQEIEYSDFPLDSISLYVIPQENLWIILLPSEY